MSKEQKPPQLVMWYTRPDPPVVEDVRNCSVRIYRTGDEKQNNKALGTGKAKKVYESTSASDSGDLAAFFVFSERNGDPAKSSFECRRQKGTAVVEMQRWGGGEEEPKLYNDGRRRPKRRRGASRGRKMAERSTGGG